MIQEEEFEVRRIYHMIRLKAKNRKIVVLTWSMARKGYLDLSIRELDYSNKCSAVSTFITSYTYYKAYNDGPHIT